MNKEDVGNVFKNSAKMVYDKKIASADYKQNFDIDVKNIWSSVVQADHYHQAVERAIDGIVKLKKMASKYRKKQA